MKSTNNTYGEKVATLHPKHSILALCFLAGSLVLCGPAISQIVSPTGTYPPPPGVPLFDLSTEYGRTRYELYMLKMAETQRLLVERQALEQQATYVRVKLAPLYAQHRGEPVWVEAWDYIQKRVNNNILLGPLQAENGDWLGIDNDDDEAPEPIFERKHMLEGKVMPAQYRAIHEVDSLNP